MEINNYEGYFIYPDGRVFSNKQRECWLSPKKTTHGYLTYQLYKNNKRTFKLLHRLIAEHYIPNPNNYHIIDHKDRDKTNNNISNLRWASSSMNALNRTWTLKKNEYERFITYIKNRRSPKKWKVNYQRFKIQKYFKTKTEALCYKYIIQLRIKANHFKIQPPASHPL